MVYGVTTRLPVKSSRIIIFSRIYLQKIKWAKHLFTGQADNSFVQCCCTPFAVLLQHLRSVTARLLQWHCIAYAALLQKVCGDSAVSYPKNGCHYSGLVTK